MFDLEQQLAGKTIAITGASRGIGRETAVLLNRFGANLMLGSRTASVPEELDKQKGRVLREELDVSDEASVRRFAERTVETYGRIDALINSAGVGTFSEFIDSATDDFDRMISVNLRGTYLCSKYFARQMVKQRNGHIINLVSIAGTTALPGCSGYSASKFGVLGLTRVMQAELRQKGVQVTALIPGAVSSSFWDGMEPKPDVSLMIPVRSVAQYIVFLLCGIPGAVVDEATIMPPLGIL